MMGWEFDRRRFLLRSAGAAFTAGAGLGASTIAATAEQCVVRTKQSQAAMSPVRALEKLKIGNARFVAGKMLKCDYTRQVRKTSSGQFPFATIVGCIDSRASNELIFDQGVGDIFSARVAGNFVNDDILGSLEFACAIIGAKLVVVAGHTECGAIKGACDDVVLGNLTQTLANIKPAVAAVKGFDPDRSSTNAAFVQAVADKNVELTLNKIRQRSKILRDMESNGDIAIAGAMYDVHTGVVAFV
jgi:carbonic anhydrase